MSCWWGTSRHSSTGTTTPLHTGETEASTEHVKLYNNNISIIRRKTHSPCPFTLHAWQGIPFLMYWNREHHAAGSKGTCHTTTQPAAKAYLYSLVYCSVFELEWCVMCVFSKCATWISHCCLQSGEACAYRAVPDGYRLFLLSAVQRNDSCAPIYFLTKCWFRF